jgi:hypothetical protein
MSDLKFTTEIQSVLTFGQFDEEGDLLITTEDPNDNSYVSFYINEKEAKAIYLHIGKQLRSLHNDVERPI